MGGNKSERSTMGLVMLKLGGLEMLKMGLVTFRLILVPGGPTWAVRNVLLLLGANGGTVDHNLIIIRPTEFVRVRILEQFFLLDNKTVITLLFSIFPANATAHVQDEPRLLN